jgi:dienelactone hydrolase
VKRIRSCELRLDLPDAGLPGDLILPARPRGLVIFVHGSGSSRLSPRNRQVARTLAERGFATLLFDLLTPAEDTDYRRRFDIPHLSLRLLEATRWAQQRPELCGLALGYFGASTGAAAALEAAAVPGADVAAVVSRGGRPDMALENLPRVRAPVLLIVGGEDHEVIRLNRRAFDALPGIKELAIVPGATHLFEEPGTLEQAAALACEWFERHCSAAGR